VFQPPFAFALPRYQVGTYTLKTWLYSITRNLIIDFYRSRKDTSFSQVQLNGLTTPGLSTESQVERTMEYERLRQAILKLNSEEQQIIILRFIEGVPYDQIAAIFGKSEGACRVIQHRP
jgi:RNA polymerase sigma-70 factor, ECF subfamily